MSNLNNNLRSSDRQKSKGKNQERIVWLLIGVAAGLVIGSTEVIIRSVKISLSKVGASSSVCSSVNDGPCLETSTGVVIGKKAGSLEQFLGIPYAEPPVGSGRWKRPQPKTPWTEPFVAEKFGPACSQLETFYPMPGVTVHGPESEDCLTLNIWRPEGKKGLPILFWVHGGGYVLGSGSTAIYAQNPDLARNAILVTINYRLGPIGFLAHPLLSAENPENISGNYGLYDVIQALQWVNDNAEILGGDRSRLTVFGQSAGGNAVTTLLRSSLASGLFSSAVVMSGTDLHPSIYLNLLRDNDPNRTSGEELGVKVVQAAYCDPPPAGSTTLDCLRAKTPEEMETAFYAGSGGADPSPYLDGILTPLETPWQQFQSGNFNKVPTVVGLSEDELMIVSAFSNLTWQEVEDKIKKNGANMGVQDLDGLANLYSSANYESPDSAYGFFSYDSNFFCPVRNFLRVIPAKHGIEGRGYYYTHRFTLLPKITGSTHGTELYYLFGSNILKSLFSRAEQQMAIVLQQAWTSIAQNTPYVKGVGAWPLFTANGTDNWVKLDVEQKIVSGMRDKECDFLDSQMIYQ